MMNKLDVVRGTIIVGVMIVVIFATNHIAEKSHDLQELRLDKQAARLKLIEDYIDKKTQYRFRSTDFLRHLEQDHNFSSEELIQARKQIEQ